MPEDSADRPSAMPLASASKPVLDGSIPGRWTLTVDLDGDLVDDDIVGPGDHLVPAVPVDEAAIERAARELANLEEFVFASAQNRFPGALRAIAETCLRAAGASN